MPPRVQGTVIVSSSLFTYLRPKQVELAAPFVGIQPKDKIGGSSLLVYEGEFDTSFAAALSENQMMSNDFSAGRRAAALAHGERSVELAPNSAVIRYAFCSALAELGQWDAALKQCSTAHNLVDRDSIRGNAIYDEVRIAIENELKAIATEPKTAGAISAR